MIRPATMADGPRLAELSSQLGYPASAEQAAARLAGVLASAAAAVFVGEVGGKVAGWVEVQQRPPLLVDGGSEAEVMGLVVDAESRRSGLGRLLMAQAEEWALDRGCRFLRLRTNVLRQDAHHFYERLGYSRLKTQTVFRKPLLRASRGIC